MQNTTAYHLPLIEPLTKKPSKLLIHPLDAVRIILLVYYNLTLESLSSRSRKMMRMVDNERYVPETPLRIAIQAVLRRHSDLSLLQIGNMMNRNHSSVVHSLRIIESLERLKFNKDPQLKIYRVFEKHYTDFMEKNNNVWEK